MYIKKIEFYNFRIYGENNTIEFNSNEPKKNVFIISGKNGYGKTTFLMALVWCLYGKQMQEVDELYHKEISDQGGYPKYILNSLNRQAKIDNDNIFSVSITFGNISIPEFPCNELMIKRSYNLINTSEPEKVEIFFDNHQSDEVNEISPEVFIRDFILPKEIAKFFFFDAEKIVNLAEITTAEQRRKISEAYSEVLGIKKYEELKRSLEDMQIKFRKESAGSKDRESMNTLSAEIENFKIEIQDHQKDIIEYNEKIDELNFDLNKVQERLIRAGSSITIDELTALKNDESNLSRSISELQDQMKELYDLIPFAINGDKMIEISNQISNENKKISQKYLHESNKEIASKIINEIMNDDERPKDVFLTYETIEYLKKKFGTLINKYLFVDQKQFEDVMVIHEFSETEINEFLSLINNLKYSFKESFKRISYEYSQTRANLSRVQSKIRDAESKKDDPIITADRERRNKLEQAISETYRKIGTLESEIERKTKEKDIKNKLVSEIAQKINVSDMNKDKDEYTARLIKELKEFILNFKEEKKKSLEEHILSGLKLFMHKKNFVDRVHVSIDGENIDIDLLNQRGEIIKKESLSKGEQQMFATAVLKGLVEESDIDFPVFIDSPMQKFDEEHAENIIRYFYPSISEQVVIFPLLKKELSADEFRILMPNIAKTYLIQNISNDKSVFKETEIKDFVSFFQEVR